ncbi:MAG: hypothetical protein ACM336_11330 [Acidobacteriota bacterium]
MLTLVMLLCGLIGPALNDPAAVYKQAREQALRGERQAALERLRAFAAMGMVEDAATNPDFASLRESAEFRDVLRQIERNKRPVSHSAVAFAPPNEGLLTEDIGYDPASGAFFLSSVRKRKIVRRGRDGRFADFIREGQDGVWSMMALGIDAKRRLLWTTTTEMDQGRSALLRYALDTGVLGARFDAPGPGPHGLGDLAVNGNGDVVVCDGKGGGVYFVEAGASTLAALVEPGTFVSPQTPAFAPDGKRIFVADYARGIGIVQLADRKVSWLETPAGLAATGIDGLYFAGGTLLALQNGTNPQRFIRLRLDEPQRRVVSWEVIEQNTPHLNEPTHGVPVDGRFYYIGTSGWRPGAPVVLVWNGGTSGD